jgi:hypothetical protein
MVVTIVLSIIVLSIFVIVHTFYLSLIYSAAFIVSLFILAALLFHSDSIFVPIAYILTNTMYINYLKHDEGLTSSLVKLYTFQVSCFLFRPS